MLRSSGRSTGRAVAGAVVAFVTGLLFYLNAVPDDTTYPRGEPSAARSSSLPDAPAGSTTDPSSGLPIIRQSDLPAEARETLERIMAGGPFPYDEDGGVFQNREELLPDRPLGHYREYTVGGRQGDRGPLRIVAGEDLDYYWTEDHYRSFMRVVSG